MGGQPSAWLRARCQSIVESSKGFELAKAIIDGEDVETFVTDEGAKIKVPASLKERREWLTLMLNRGWGMPTQVVETLPPSPDAQMTGEDVRMRLLEAIPVLLRTLPSSTQERAAFLAGLKQAEVVMGEP